MILKCSCSHIYQDGKYGKGMRVHNPTLKQPVGTIFRCTICEKERSEKGDGPIRRGKST